jgi:hypothetical protein
MEAAWEISISIYTDPFIEIYTYSHFVLSSIAYCCQTAILKMVIYLHKNMFLSSITLSNEPSNT